MADQQRVFQPGGKRRIVIATNVAESSLTVPRIRYVIDPGTARISRYSPRSKTQRLPIEAVSRASADQRAGRCGRIAPGVCVRLFSEEDYAARDRFTAPEIQRTNLAAVILQTTALRLGEIEDFPFLDPPKHDAVRDGYRTLFELGAIDENRELTEIGRKLSRLPVDPRIGRMILAADEENCLAEVLIIAAALEIQDPRERPLEKQEAADKAHAQFIDADSDFLSYLKLWEFYHHLKETLSRNQLQKACKQNFLSYNRMREWSDIHRELMELVQEADFFRKGINTARSVHAHACRGHERERQRTANMPTASVGMPPKSSDSANRKNTPPFIARFSPACFRAWRKRAKPTNTPSPAAAREISGPARACFRGGRNGSSPPKWSKPRGDISAAARRSIPAGSNRWPATWSNERTAIRSGIRPPPRPMAIERVTLFGLTIVPGRRVRFGPIDPQTSRELLIRHGLVEGQFEKKPDFLVHNEKLLEEMERLQAKLRRRDLLLGEWTRYEFYDRRIPDDVYDGPRLMKWLRDLANSPLPLGEGPGVRAELRQQPSPPSPNGEGTKLLYMSPSDLDPRGDRSRRRGLSRHARRAAHRICRWIINSRPAKTTTASPSPCRWKP